MKPTVTREATHNFQAPANWQPDTDGQCGDLQVRAETFGERNIVELFSTWMPSDEDRALIAAGGVIEIGICSPTQPVMQVRVVEPVPPSLVNFVSHEGTADEQPQEARPAAPDPIADGDLPSGSAMAKFLNDKA